MEFGLGYRQIIERFFWPHIFNILLYWFFFPDLPSKHSLVKKCKIHSMLDREQGFRKTLLKLLSSAHIWRSYTKGSYLCHERVLPWPIRPQQDMPACLNQSSRIPELKSPVFGWNWVQFFMPFPWLYCIIIICFLLSLFSST